MRVALVVHGLPPRERTGVESHCAELALALARAGAEVLVLAAFKECDVPHLSERRQRRDGYTVDWLALNEPPRDVLEEACPPGVAQAVGEWLDREQPDVVHVQHVKGLGWGVLEAVSSRGIPLVMTAHDDYALCHRVTHLRPDLERCAAIGEVERCARCDLAVRALHGRPELGDWHMGVFPEDVAPDVRDRLQRALEGDLEQRELAEAIERRREASALRTRALRCADAVLVPSETLRTKLEQGGLERERLHLVPYGIDVDGLAGLRPPATDASSPLRLGFLGGMAKHKGAHHLLEAFRGVRGATLEVFGDSTDQPYVARVRSLCDEVGARWNGAFERSELRAILERVDVVCVPSLWDENAPFVLREAFAAGRPVIASRTAALEESVRDGVNGLCVELGDVGAWRSALQRLASDRELVRKLASGVRRPPTIQTMARDLLALYGTLAARRAVREDECGLPEHLRGFQSRRLALRRAPLDELYARVRGGLLRLRAELSPDRAAEARDDSPRAAVERARELLRDRERKARWTEDVSADDRRARESLAEESRWLASELTQRESELEWRRADAQARAQHHARELEGMREELAARQAEGLWLRELVAVLERERDALQDERSAVHRALDALTKHERWLREETRDLAGLLGAADVGSPAGPIAPEKLAATLARARTRASGLGAELAWRRAEMERALDDGGQLLKAVVAVSALGRRFHKWRGRPREHAP